jgi:hypothetical protein
MILLRMAIRPGAEQARHGVTTVDFPWESLVDRLIQWHYGHPWAPRSTVRLMCSKRAVPRTSGAPGAGCPDQAVNGHGFPVSRGKVSSVRRLTFW